MAAEATATKVRISLDAIRSLADNSNGIGNIIQFSDAQGNQGSIVVTADGFLEIQLPQYSLVQPSVEQEVKPKKRGRPRKVVDFHQTFLTGHDEAPAEQDQEESTKEDGAKVEGTVTRSGRTIKRKKMSDMEVYSPQYQGGAENKKEKSKLRGAGHKAESQHSSKASSKTLEIVWGSLAEMQGALDSVEPSGPSFDKIFFKEKSISGKGHTFRCQLCNLQLISRTLSYSHWAQMHPDLLPFDCPVCNVKVVSRGKLKSHLVFHTNHRPIACGQCGKSFRSRAKLNEHMMFHSDKRRYPCGVCGWKFHYSSALRKHVASVHANRGPKKYRMGRRGMNTSKIDRRVEEFKSDQTTRADEPEVGAGKMVIEETEAKNRDRTVPYLVPDLLPVADVIPGRIDSRGLASMGVLRCKLCGDQFSSQKKLCYHLAGTHPHHKVWKCKICPYASAIRSNLSAHVRHRHATDDTLFVCQVCSRSFATRAQHRVHMARHTGELKHGCRYCSRRFVTAQQLKQHCVNTHPTELGIRPKVCKECGDVLRTPSQAYRHQRRHKTQPITCKYCEKTFRGSYTYKHHVLSHNFLFRCGTCSKEFRTMISLNYHMKLHESGGKEATCSYCNKQLATKESLKRHIQAVHENAKPYSCDVCQKQYKAKRNLQEHVRTVHEQIRPHTCGTCFKSFARASALSAHVPIHRPGPSFPCPLCDRSFLIKAQLNTHLKVHEAERGSVRGVMPPVHQALATPVEASQHSALPTAQTTVVASVCPQCHVQLPSLDSFPAHLAVCPATSALVDQLPVRTIDDNEDNTQLLSFPESADTSSTTVAIVTSGADQASKPIAMVTDFNMVASPEQSVDDSVSNQAVHVISIVDSENGGDGTYNSRVVTTSSGDVNALLQAIGGEGGEHVLALDSGDLRGNTGEGNRYLTVLLEGDDQS